MIIVEASPDFNVGIRAPNEEDRNFIIKSCVESQKEFRSHLVTEKDFKRTERNRLLIELESSLISIACNPEEANQIYGYVIYHIQPATNIYILHYGYTKYPFRKLHVFKSLLQSTHPHFGTLPIYSIRPSLQMKHLEKYLVSYRPEFY